MLITLVFVFGLLYVWRKIYSIECYNQILEKKIMNLKKENKGLQDLLQCNSSGCTINDADIIMENIFSEKCTKNLPSKKNISKSTEILNVQNVVQKETKTEQNDKTYITDVTGATDVNIAPDTTDATIENVISGNIVLPVIDVCDAESVISDSNIFNHKKLLKMNLDKLKATCISMHLSVEGTRNILIERILAAQ
jgi:hypothetical protein